MIDFRSNTKVVAEVTQGRKNMFSEQASYYPLFILKLLLTLLLYYFLYHLVHLHVCMSSHTLEETVEWVQVGFCVQFKGTPRSKVHVKQHVCTVGVRTEGTAVVLLWKKQPIAHCRITVKQSGSKRDLFPAPCWVLLSKSVIVFLVFVQ